MIKRFESQFFTVSISFCATVSLLVSVLSHVLVVQKMPRDILSGTFGLQRGWNGKLETVIGERGCVGRKQMHTWPIVNSALAVCKKVISCLSSWYSCALCFIIALSSGRTGTLLTVLKVFSPVVAPSSGCARAGGSVSLVEEDHIIVAEGNWEQFLVLLRLRQSKESTEEVMWPLSRHFWFYACIGTEY